MGMGRFKIKIQIKLQKKIDLYKKCMGASAFRLHTLDVLIVLINRLLEKNIKQSKCL